MMRQFKFSSNRMIFLCSALLLLTPCVALGQITNVTDDQSAPAPGTGHDYFKMLSETVNPANGSVSLRIGVPVPESRGITIPFSFAYDSNGVHHFIPVANQPGWLVWTSNNTFISQGGWSYSVPLVSQMYQTRTVPNPPYPPWNCNFYNDYTFQDPKGGRHALYLSYVLPTNPSRCTVLDLLSFSSANEDYFYATISNTSTVPPAVTLQDADGTVYNFSFAHAHSSIPYSGANGYSALPDTIEDRNGNMVGFTDSGNGAFTMQDTVGRSAVVSSGFGTSGNTVTVSGLSNPYTIDWETINLTGYNPGAKLLTTQDPNCPTAFPSLSGSETVISSIALPNGQSYQFSYDTTTGLLQKIIYPTGGYVRYVWAIQADWENASFSDTNGNAYACVYEYGVPVVSDRYVSFDGANEVLHQKFVYSVTWGGVTQAWTDKKTTVTTTDNSRIPAPSSTTVYDYSPFSVGYPPNDTGSLANVVPLENTITYNDWNTSGSGLLRTVTKEWWDQYLLGCDQETLGPSGPGSMALYYYRLTAWFSQMTEKDEYDFGTTCPTTLPSQAPTASLLRKTAITYATIGNTGIADRPSQIVTCNASPCSSSQNSVAETDYSYDGKGNATSKTQRCLYNCSPDAFTYYTYDTNGQQMSMQDPNGNTTTYAYDASYDLYLTKITYPPTNGVPHIVQFGYDGGSGSLTSSIDQNNQTTSYQYSDPLGRLTQINNPDGGTITYTYNDGSPTSNIVTSQTIDSNTKYVTTQVFDGVGHVTETQINSDLEGADYTDTTYDGLGRVWKVSNPYRSQSDTTYGVTNTTYDALGRASDEGTTKSIVYPEGSATSTAYSGNSTTVTDPQGNARTTLTDALGRMYQVTEDPSGLDYTTAYAYDVLGNLLTVTQGTQTRTFNYDSLSRLYRATNPESGTTSYTYDANGNVLTKQDARGVTTNYAKDWNGNPCPYDALNRLVCKSYSDGTPTAKFFYDESSVSLANWSSGNLPYPVGRLTHTTTVNSGGTVLTATVQDYDNMGQVYDYWQCSPYNCNSSSIWHSNYLHKYTGEVYQWIDPDPSGFTLTNTISAAGRITAMQSSWVDSNHPQYLAKSISYTPWGAVSTLVNGAAGGGTGAQETYQYNQRLQPALIQLVTTDNPPEGYCLVYDYYGSHPTRCSSPSEGTNNNGNVMGYWDQDNTQPFSHTATYTYDTVNRLTSGVATGSVAYNLTFSYTIPDGSTGQYGNMSCVTNGQTNGLCANLSFNAANNQITTSGYKYDAAGNLTKDPSNLTAHTYQWDAEGRVASVDSGSTWSFTYNALGHRVQWAYPGGTYQHFFDPQGGWLGVLGNYDIVRFADRYLVTYWGNNTVFNHVNNVDSTRMLTNPTGAAAEDMLFYPWGDVWQSWGGGGYNFAGLPIRDLTTNTDLTKARVFGPNFGRSFSPDPGPWILVNPQSYNAYTYGLNNPARYSDDGGETPQDRVNAAYGFAGQNIPYRYDGKEPGCGLDCSGLVQNVFKADPDNPITPLDWTWSAAGQANQLEQAGEYSTNINDAQPGDAIFFSGPNGNIVHTGIVVYVKGGKVYFVHAPHTDPPRNRVRVAHVDMKDLKFGAEKFAGVGRPIEPPKSQPPNPVQNYNMNPHGSWNWFDELNFNFGPSGLQLVPASPGFEITFAPGS